MAEPILGPNRGNAGKGRPKGATNKTPTLVKDMILQALSKAGGAEYLYTQAMDSPTAFMALVGKLLPMQHTGEEGGPIKTEAVSGELEAFKNRLLQATAAARASGDASES